MTRIEALNELVAQLTDQATDLRQALVATLATLEELGDIQIIEDDWWMPARDRANAAVAAFDRFMEEDR